LLRAKSATLNAGILGLAQLLRIKGETMTEQLRDRRKHKFVVVDNPVLADCELSDSAFRLYCTLLKYAGQDNGCWPGLSKLAQDMNKGKSTISRLFDELTNKGLISRQRRFKRSSITWIEDTTSLYDEHLKNEIYLKNEIISKMRQQEHLKNEMTEVDPDIDIMVDTVVSILVSFGIDTLQAQKLTKQGVTPELANAWIEYTKGRNLQNPQGFVVSRLKLAEFPPTDPRQDREDTNRYLGVGSEFEDLIQH
jgi:DNA-binding MarR family transcriptional regulator